MESSHGNLEATVDLTFKKMRKEELAVLGDVVTYALRAIENTDGDNGVRFRILDDIRRGVVAAHDTVSEVFDQCAERSPSSS